MNEEITAASAGISEHDLPTRPIRPATLAESAASFRPFRRRFVAGLVAALPWLALGLAAFVEIVLVVIGAGFDLIFATGALAAALRKLMANPELRRRMGAAGRARAERDYSLAGMAERFTQVWTEVAEQ